MAPLHCSSVQTFGQWMPQPQTLTKSLVGFMAFIHCPTVQKGKGDKKQISSPKYQIRNTKFGGRGLIPLEQMPGHSQSATDGFGTSGRIC
jgi:hypothetical protein